MHPALLILGLSAWSRKGWSISFCGEVGFPLCFSPSRSLVNLKGLAIKAARLYALSRHRLRCHSARRRSQIVFCRMHIHLARPMCSSSPASFCWELSSPSWFAISSQLFGSFTGSTRASLLLLTKPFSCNDCGHSLKSSVGLFLRHCFQNLVVIVIELLPQWLMVAASHLISD